MRRDGGRRVRCLALAQRWSRTALCHARRCRAPSRVRGAGAAHPREPRRRQHAPRPARRGSSSARCARARPAARALAGSARLPVDRGGHPRARAAAGRVRAAPRVRGDRAHAPDRPGAPLHRAHHRLAARRPLRHRPRVSHSVWNRKRETGMQGVSREEAIGSHDLRDPAPPAGASPPQRVRRRVRHGPHAAVPDRVARLRRAAHVPHLARSRCASTTVR